MTISPRARADLWSREAALHPDGFPRCNICGGAVQPGQAWDESHDPNGTPAAWGGTETGIAHAKCNRDHGAKIVGPMVAKAKRRHKKHIGSHGPGRGTKPLPCGRLSRLSKTFSNGVVVRRSQAEKLRETLARRGFTTD